MSDWRVSRSGYSIVTGQGDERRVIASMPVNVPKEVIQPWLEAAMELVDLQSGLQAENARLASEVARLREALKWYQSEAEAIARYQSAKPPKTEATMASMTVLSLDAGQRAAKALAKP